MTFTNDEGADERWDRLIPDAVSVIREYDRASASLLQRRLRVGYARAARIIDQLEALGHVGAFDGTNDRLVLRREDEFVAPEQATSDPRLMEAHATLTIARSVLGVGTPSLSDLGVANVDDLYRIGDLYDFECASCGRLSEVYEAATAVNRTGFRGDSADWIHAASLVA